MARRTGRKGKGKVTLARTDPKTVALQAEVERLQSQGAEVNVDKREMKITGAWRKDVFSILRNRRGKPCDGYSNGKQALSETAYSAFRGHESDIQLAAGAIAHERSPDYIRGDSIGAPGQNITSEAIDAQERVKASLKGLPLPDARLLNALMDGDAALAQNWRATVQRETQETDEKAQASRIRALGENLHHARVAAIVKQQKRKPDNDNRPTRVKEPKPITWFRGDLCG